MENSINQFAPLPPPDPATENIRLMREMVQLLRSIDRKLGKPMIQQHVYPTVKKYENTNTTVIKEKT